LKETNKSTIKGCSVFLRDKINSIDWKLLVFLILFLNVKLLVKVIAIILLYFLRPDFSFGFRLKNSRLPFFYIIVIAIAVINLVISRLFTQLNYDLVFAAGISFWAILILAIHQVKLSIEKNDPAIIHRTLVYFFMLNVAVSLLMYSGIVWQAGTLNPFRYQGEFQKYFISTGDYIRGITLDNSTTNAIINAFGVFYFLSRKNIVCCLSCMAILLLTGSNLVNILFCLVLLYVFIFQSTKDQKSVLVICAMLLVVFLAKVSPENKNYLSEYYDIYCNNKIPQADNKLVNIVADRSTETKQQIARAYLDSVNNLKEANKVIGGINPLLVSQITGKPAIPVANINSSLYQHKQDTTELQKRLLYFIDMNKALLPLSGKDTPVKLLYPGKVLALQQTVNYLAQHPAKILTGTGPGNFSSKLAYRSTAMNISGGYPVKYAYINRDFTTNHLDLYLYYFSRLDFFHSVINTPNAVYDQLLAEYGVLGLLSFFIFYIAFFTRHYKQLTYGIPILLIMIGAFFIDYWFEQLSVVIIFELLLLLNNKEAQIKQSLQQ